MPVEAEERGPAVQHVFVQRKRMQSVCSAKLSLPRALHRLKLNSHGLLTRILAARACHYHRHVVQGPALLASMTSGLSCRALHARTA